MTTTIASVNKNDVKKKRTSLKNVTNTEYNQNLMQID